MSKKNDSNKTNSGPLFLKPFEAVNLLEKAERRLKRANVYLERYSSRKLYPRQSKVLYEKVYDLLLESFELVNSVKLGFPSQREKRVRRKKETLPKLS